MTVIQLVRSSNKETVSVLRCMLEKAVAGQLDSLAACFHLSNGTEEAIFTGRYNASPAYALAASMKISWKLNQMQNEPL